MQRDDDLQRARRVDGGLPSKMVHARACNPVKNLVLAKLGKVAAEARMSKQSAPPPPLASPESLKDLAEKAASRAE